MNYISLPEAVQFLLNEKLVIIPTETVYGLAGIATSPKAIKTIFEYKSRPQDNPLICHFYSISHIQEYTQPIPEPIRILLDTYSPGPLTVLLPIKDNRLFAAIRGQNTVACRIPQHPLTLQLIQEVHTPIAAPSANPSGLPSSTTAEMAYQYFQDKSGGILASDPSSIGLESTIIQYKDNRIHILREGAIGYTEIQNLLPNISIIRPTTYTITIPGAKYRHYSPKTPIYYYPISQIIPNQSAIIITKNTILPPYPADTQIISIANSNNPTEIAHNLYQTLIQLDTLSVNQAYWYIPNIDLNSSIAKALMNRLSKIILDTTP
jgi:L-threonylcarbamoyladenylate synthase